MREKTEFNTWQAIQKEVLERIRTREWIPGNLIPNEADLAQEFGCARATVNRALRQLAEDGILERKRRSGTRVVRHPVAKTVFDIQIVRHEIEEKGGVYGYHLLESKIEQPPASVNFALSLQGKTEALNLRCAHLKDGVPYALEERWINLDAVPQALAVDFTKHSANEWLLENVPYTKAQSSILSVHAKKLQHDYLNVPMGEPLLQLDRTTWNVELPVTFVSLWYCANHRFVSMSKE